MHCEHYRELARSLVGLFYPLVETTLFDAHGEFEEVFNPFSTIKEDRECDFDHVAINQMFVELLSVGRDVRSIIHPFYVDGAVAGYMRVRYDLTCFKNLQEQLKFLVHSPADLLAPSTADTWKRQIDQKIECYLSENRLNLQAVSNKQKREMISKLRDQGLLDFKESSAYVASKLQVSRATVYNYLKTAAELKKVHVHQVDAFTKEKFGGNPAGVVLDADGLDETTMRKITRELNLSETAFVLSHEQASFQIRYFTPTGHEINFCGHSTVGVLYMLAKEHRFGVVGNGSYPFKVETRSGVLKMEVRVDGDEIQVVYETPVIKLHKSKISHDEIAAAAGFDPHFIDMDFPVMYEKTNKDLFIVIDSLEHLKQIECDSKSLALFSKQQDIVALCLICAQTVDPKHQFHMRCFAPLVGIPEDPFTGSVLGGMTAYVDLCGLLSKKAHSFQVEQGHFIQRPGVVRVEFERKGKGYKAQVVAEAVHCFSTEINLT